MICQKLSLLFACLMISGCLQNYTGMYDVYKENSELTSETLRLDVEEILTPFGFHYAKIWKDKPDYGFTRKIEMTSPDLMKLEGANANISIVVWNYRPGITIRDFDNYEETKFIKELKNSLERELNKKYNINLECTKQRTAIFNN